MMESKNFWNHDIFLGITAPTTAEHQDMLEIIFSLLRSRGFEIQIDPEKLQRYPSIAKDYFYGRKGDLEFHAERHPALCEIEFFQNVKFENPHGGRYDFDKFQKMPYQLRLRYLVEISYVKDLLQREGYDNHSKLISSTPEVLKTAEEKVLYHILSSCHFKDRDQSKEYDYNNQDKDGRKLDDGQVKYFRDRKGRLMRGTVYHNINNMWWVVVNKYRYNNIASFDLFDLDAKEENRMYKLIKKSGHHNQKSRTLPSVELIKQYQKAARTQTREQRLSLVNEFLKYLHSIKWFGNHQIYLKKNNHLGVMWIDKNGTVHTDAYLSGTEDGWFKQFREFINTGKPSVTSWFCKDCNGYGGSSYLWPEVRERLLEIGAFVLPERKAG